jgi:hypothetical protein
LSQKEAKFMVTKSSLSDSELQRFAEEHVFYEIDMLFATANLIGSGAPHPKMNNAFTESFVLHLRNLISFFYSKPTKPTDVVASDFFAKTGEWDSQRPPKSAKIEVALQRAHKELAHLTTKRIAGSSAVKEWHVDDLVNELSAIIEKFIAGASPNWLKPATASDIRALLNPPPPTTTSTPGANVAGLTRSSLTIS